MNQILTVAAYISAATMILAAARRWLLKPIRGALLELRQLVAQIRTADHVALELSALAGATTHLMTELMSSRFQDQQRLDDIAELVVDLNADVHRLTRDLADLQMSA